MLLKLFFRKKSPQPSIAKKQSEPEKETEMATKSAHEDIGKAVAAGVLSCIGTAGLMLYSIYTEDLLQMDWWSSLDILLIAGFTFGIYRKSRAAAVSLLVYFLASKVCIGLMDIDLFKRPATVFFTFLFLYFFALGVRGTFRLHKIESAKDK